MDLINTSPGGFFTLANTLFYLMVGIEVAMCVVNSMLGVALMLTLIIASAFMLLRAVLRLMDDDRTNVRVPAPSAPAVPVSRVPRTA